MPGFDGTGPTGLGPMTGQGMGYCMLKISQVQNLNPCYGYSGVQGIPVKVAYPAFMNPYCLLVKRFYHIVRYGRRFGFHQSGRRCRFTGYYW